VAGYDDIALARIQLGALAQLVVQLNNIGEDVQIRMALHYLRLVKSSPLHVPPGRPGSAASSADGDMSEWATPRPPSSQADAKI
jgi:hypothetical protein